jgi:hypothetical protein
VITQLLSTDVSTVLLLRHGVFACRHPLDSLASLDVLNTRAAGISQLARNVLNCRDGRGSSLRSESPSRTPVKCIGDVGKGLGEGG